jgi:hypothetical protein
MEKRMGIFISQALVLPGIDCYLALLAGVFNSASYTVLRFYRQDILLIGHDKYIDKINQNNFRKERMLAKISVMPSNIKPY